MSSSVFLGGALCALLLVRGPVNAQPLSSTDWRADLDSVLAWVQEIHADPFHKVPEAVFRGEVARLKQEAASQNPDERLVGLMRLVASIGDGHTYVAPTAFRVYPLQVYFFADGPYVTNTLPSHAALIGQQLVAINGVAVDTLVARIRPLFGVDSAMQRQSWLPLYLLLDNVLHGLRLTTRQTATFTVQDETGAHTAVQLEALDAATYLDTLGIIPPEIAPYVPRNFSIYLNFAEALPPQPDGPRYLRNLATPLGLHYLEAEQVLYVPYHFVRNGVESVAGFSVRLSAFLDAHPVSKVVVDVRNNIGGNNSLNSPLVHVFAEHPKLRQRGALYAILGRRTFSAATDFVAALENRTPTLFFGEPTGGAPNHYGNPKTRMLPHFEISLSLSSYFWQHGFSSDQRSSTVPDVQLSLTHLDYFAQRDPVLEAILRHTPPPRVAAPLSNDLYNRLIGTYASDMRRSVHIGTAKTALRLTMTDFVSTTLTYAGDHLFMTDLTDVTLRFAPSDSVDAVVLNVRGVPEVFRKVMGE